MRSLPLFRFNRRARSTSWGIALCTMFIVASFSIASGLRTSMDALSDNFVSEYSLVSYPGESGLEAFDMTLLGNAFEKSAFCLVAAASTGTADVVVFSVYDHGGVLHESFDVSGAEVKAGEDVDLTGLVTLTTDVAEVDVSVVSRFSSSMFPSTWLLASDDILQELMNEGPSSCNLAVVKGLTSYEQAEVERWGACVQPMVSIVGFLDSSVQELESDAYWVLVPSAFAIAVLAYGFIGAEVSDKRHDIGIIKTIGAGRWRVFKYLLGEALVLCAYGGALGLALGIVLSYGISTAASHVFTSAFVVEMDETLLLLSFAVTVAAGVFGALLPAARMTRSSPVEDLREGLSS